MSHALCLTGCLARTISSFKYNAQNSNHSPPTKDVVGLFLVAYLKDQLTMANYNPHGAKELPVKVNLEDLFKDIPYKPVGHNLTADEKERFECKMALLRQSVVMLNDNQLNAFSFKNERALISYYDKLFANGQLVSSDDALQKAIDSNVQCVQETWLKIADALEKRKTYKARVF